METDPKPTGGARLIAGVARTRVRTSASDELTQELIDLLKREDFQPGDRLPAGTVLGQTIDSLLDLYAAEQMVILQVYDNRERDAREHRAVLEAIRDGQAELAATRMREHLTGVRTVVEERLR